MLEFGPGGARQHITLTDQLTLSGAVRHQERPLADALVVLSEASGEVVRSAHSDDSGRYCMPMPGAGGTS